MLGDPLFWALVLPGLLLGMYAQGRIKANVAKWELRLKSAAQKCLVLVQARQAGGSDGTTSSSSSSGSGRPFVRRWTPAAPTRR